MEMVERVARALFLAEHPNSEWSAGRARSKWWSLAEAAIAAMREPTAEMLAARYSHRGDNYDVAEGAYRSMIDAALPAQSMAEIS